MLSEVTNVFEVVCISVIVGLVSCTDPGDGAEDETMDLLIAS